MPLVLFRPGNGNKKGRRRHVISGERALITVFLYALIQSVKAVTIEESAFNSFAAIGAESTSNDEPTHISVSADNIIILGGTSSPYERGQESDLGKPLQDGLREEDFFIAKVDGEDGSVKWVFRGGSSKEDRLHALLVDKSGKNVYVGGRTFGKFRGTSKIGQADMFIVKYDISGKEPKEVWEKPLILGTTASDSVTSLAFDPKDENLIYATGFTNGNLFPGKAIEGSGLSDAVLFSFAAADGTVVHKYQFGTQHADQATGMVISEKEDGPIFVSVITDRQIGQYSFGNFHMYKFKRDVTPLGDLLLRSYSREQMASFREHPMLPGTLIGSGSSWLDSRNGYDVFVKRVVRMFDDSNIGSREMDIDEVSKEEYTKRLRSSDGGHDYATGMIVDPESGRLIISGYTGGAFAPGSHKQGLLAPFIASVDPLDASLTDAKQMGLPTSDSWVEISCITMAPGRRGIYYVAKESNTTTNLFHLNVGSFGFPAAWKTQITIAPSPDPTPSPKRDTENSKVKKKEKKVPVAIIAGSICGGIVLIVSIIALVMCSRMNKRSKAAKMYAPEKKGNKPKKRSKPAPSAEAEEEERGNAAGLV